MKRYRSLLSIQQDLAKGAVTIPELANYYLRNIRENSHLNAFLEVYEEEVLKKAEEVQKKYEQGAAGKLAGMILGLKDNICYKDHKVSASSKILEGFTSLYSATATERLLAEDAIIIGRLNCDEFAMGASNENSAYGPVLNALDNNKVPGGSSGGSAVAVQADLCLSALGSDTGGSIRQPASFTGNIGFKPTYGRISRWGLLAYASSFDQIGPITSSVYDSALLTEIMSGKDEKDATCSDKEVPAYSSSNSQHGVRRIGIIRDSIESDGLDPEIKVYFYQLIEQLKSKGLEVDLVDFPYLDYMVPVYYVLTTAEASSNLARYQGLLYGYRSAKAEDLESTFKKSRSEGFGPEVQRRIMTGTFVLSSDHYDAYYTKAQKVRRVITERTEELLESYDLLISPTTPGTAFDIGSKSNDPIAMYLADIFTVQANIAGIPAISLPTGKHSNGMPFGIQLMASKFDDHRLLAFSAQLMEEQWA